MRKLKFFLIGLIPGLVIVFFILNKKGASCSGYLPNSRVIAETLSKEFTYSPDFQAEMKILKVDEKFLKDSILTKGNIDFERSEAQKTGQGRWASSRCSSTQPTTANAKAMLPLLSLLPSGLMVLVSPTRATHFSLFAQRKVSKRKRPPTSGSGLWPDFPPSGAASGTGIHGTSLSRYASRGHPGRSSPCATPPLGLLTGTRLRVA